MNDTEQSLKGICLRKGCMRQRDDGDNFWCSHCREEWRSKMRYYGIIDDHYVKIKQLKELFVEFNKRGI